MHRRDIVVVGASAGGVESLVTLVGGFPADLPAAVFVVLHVPPDAPSALPAILSRSGPLPAVTAVDGDDIRHGAIYVAPPNQHLYVGNRHVHVAVGPRENGARPAVDVLFRSAARAYGRRVVGVVLSGTLSDGALGLALIKQRHGAALVQDPAEALFVGMPRSALAATDVDYCAPVARLSSLVDELVRDPMQQPMEDRTDEQLSQQQTDPVQVEGATAEKEPGTASGLTCPECHGSIWELRDGESVRFECRVGHAYAPEAFLIQQGERVEAALWTAINTLRERSESFLRLAELNENGSRVSQRYRERAKETGQQADLIRDLLYKLLNAGEVG